MSLLHSLSCNWTWFPSRNAASSDSSKACKVMMTVLERAVNPSCNCSEQTAGLVVSVKRLWRNICHQVRTIGGIMYFGASACVKLLDAFMFRWTAWPCTRDAGLCISIWPCMLMLMLFVCAVGVPFSLLFTDNLLSRLLKPGPKPVEQLEPLHDW